MSGKIKVRRSDSSLPDRDSKSHAEKRVRETSSVSSNSSLDCSVDEFAVELYEALWDQEDTYTILKTFMEEFAEIEFQRLHRNGNPKEDSRPRPIIARFLRYGDREFVFSNAKSLKGTEYGIPDDLPREFVKSEARKASKRPYFIRAEPDKLFIDGVLCPR